MKQDIGIKESIQNLIDRIKEAGRDFDIWINTNDEYAEPSWLIEVCFLQLLAIIEALELEEFRKMVYSEYVNIKASKDGFLKTKVSPDGDPFSASLSIIRRFVLALESFFPIEDHTRVTKDLLQIIRDIHYVITDIGIYQSIPSNENDVHIRIEGILKCVFPDLKHKPALQNK